MRIAVPIKCWIKGIGGEEDTIWKEKKKKEALRNEPYLKRLWTSIANTLKNCKLHFNYFLNVLKLKSIWKAVI